METIEVAKNEISVEELLREIYSTLCQSIKGTRVVLGSKGVVKSEIGSDSDEHRTKIGYMSYSEYFLFEKNSKWWAISLGTKTGDYPGNEYKCDLVAFILSNIAEPKALKEFRGILEKKNYFRNSFIIAMYDGNIAMRKSLINLIGEKIGEFIANEATYTENFSMDGTPCVQTETSYKKEAVIFFAEKLQILFA